MSSEFKYIEFPTLGRALMMLHYGYSGSKLGLVAEITKLQVKDQCLSKTGPFSNAAIVKQQCNKHYILFK